MYVYNKNYRMNRNMSIDRYKKEFNTDNSVENKLSAMKTNLEKEMQEIKDSTLDPKIKEHKLNYLNKRLEEVNKRLKTDEENKSKNPRTLEGRVKILESIARNNPEMLLKNPLLIKKLKSADLEEIKAVDKKLSRLKADSADFQRRRLKYNNYYRRSIY